MAIADVSIYNSTDDIISTSNGDGYFEININNYPAEIIFYTEGFNLKTLIISEKPVKEININLESKIEELNEVTISDFDPGEQEISLNNIFEIYKSGFSYKFLGEKNNLRLVEIYPDDQEKSYFKILFKIDTAGLLYSFSVFDKSNSTFVYMINDFKEEELENTLFTFIPEDYPEIEVIDFR